MCPRAEDKQISRRTRWTVLRLESEGPTEGVYDALWQALGKEGKRWLSVAQRRSATRPALTRAMVARLTSPPYQRAQRLATCAA